MNLLLSQEIFIIKLAGFWNKTKKAGILTEAEKVLEFIKVPMQETLGRRFPLKALDFQQGKA